MDENQLQILDDLPSSAVEMQVKDKVCVATNFLFFFFFTQQVKVPQQ